jgi:predicted nucleic acid-binding protein
MNRDLLISYAFIKSVYEKTYNYIDTFSPFVILSLYKFKDFVDLYSIQKNIDSEFGIKIPLHSLTYIITRLKRTGNVASENIKYKLTEKGEKFKNELEPIRNVERRINEVVDDLARFINDKVIKHEKVYEILLNFINKNIDSVIDFCIPENKSDIDLDKKTITGFEEKIIDYFKEVERSRPQIWKTLKDIVYGSVIAYASVTIDISESDRKFKSLKIYLDSNFIFSLLELHEPDNNKPVIELFQMLKDYGFNILVFDFTLNEIANVLKNYINAQYNYYEFIKVSSIYSILKRKGWSSQDIFDYIQVLEDNIKELGISIDRTPINLDKFEPSEDAVSALARVKEYSEYTFKHDLAAISMIERIRGYKKYKIESSRAIFLTSDLRLAKVNFKNMGHRDNCTICEVITDRLFTNILWLKNPKVCESIPMSAVISANSKTILIDKRIWEKFLNNLNKLREDGKVDSNKITMLFYNNFIQNELLRFDERDADKVTQDFILDKVYKSAEIIDEKIKKEIREKETQLKEEGLKQDKKLKELIEERIHIENVLKDETETESRRITNFILVLIIVLFGFVLYLISSYFQNEYLKIPNLISIYFFIDIFVDFKKASLKEIIKKKILDHRLNKKIKKLNLYK